MNVLEFLYKWVMSVLLHLLIQSMISNSMDSWVFISYARLYPNTTLFIFLLNLFQIWPLGAPSVDFSVASSSFLHGAYFTILVASHFLSLQDDPASSCIFPGLLMEMAIPQESLLPLIGEWYYTVCVCVCVSKQHNDVVESYCDTICSEMISDKLCHTLSHWKRSVFSLGRNSYYSTTTQTAQRDPPVSSKRPSDFPTFHSCFETFIEKTQTSMLCDKIW